MRCRCYCRCTLRMSRHRLPHCTERVRHCIMQCTLQELRCNFFVFTLSTSTKQSADFTKESQAVKFIDIVFRRISTFRSPSKKRRKFLSFGQETQFVDCFVKSARKYLRRVGNYSDCRKYKRETSPRAKRRMNTLNCLSGTSGQTVIASFPVALHLKCQE